MARRVQTIAGQDGLTVAVYVFPGPGICWLMASVMLWQFAKSGIVNTPVNVDVPPRFARFAFPLMVTVTGWLVPQESPTRLTGGNGGGMGGVPDGYMETM